MDRSWSRERLTRVLGDWSCRDDGALFRQLAERFRQLIHAGDIPNGVRIPSERAIASALGVSRSTVVTAMDQLRDEGLIVSRQGAGTYVSRAGWHSAARGDSRLNTFLDSNPIKGLIDLRSAALPGLPMVADEMSHLGSADMKNLVSSHGYLPHGLPLLREAVARYFEDFALPTEPAEVLITSGAQQALRLVSSAVLEPGATVLVEEPTFRGAIETLRSIGASLVPVASGPDGIDLAELRRLAHQTSPAMIFVQSGGNNPTGAVMSAQSRATLARIAADVDTLVVEDAAVNDAAIDDAPLPPIHGFGARVITIGSASKSFWGGLRVGWLRGDGDLIHHLTVVKGGEDLGTSVLAQLLTASLMPKMALARQQRQESLCRSREILLELLADSLPDWEPTVPHAGASMWIRLPEGSATAFAQHAGRLGVSILAGPTFSCADRLDDHVRVAFAARPEVIVHGLGRLSRAWREFA
ncbi:PLP-dependent aminotransferase family protein [Jiangella asiatica]|uniref:PLP-dependent aminotransferase family protein n=1 Tax=Jiangella asiatica TaxID=2530372 RepID=A0A4V2Z083_9ACTN|nr:PLP-dependent aminotransferase family protein [Jiangella asiatica]TDD99917.1 PLP-dependent aminotransferase family protein [Jiangella asiatica]